MIEDGRDRDRADDGGGARPSLHQGLRPADQGAGDRHDRDRRRRRLDRGDRRGRPAEGRPAFRRLRSRPRLLRHGRHEADRDRRQSRARLLRSRLLPRRPHGARSRRGASAPSRRSPSRSASRSSKRPGASTRSSSRAWRRRRACISSRRARIRAAMPWSASAAPVRRMRPTSRARMGVARGDHPAGLRRGFGARLPRGAAVVRAGALAARSSSPKASTPRRSTRALAELEAEGRKRLTEAGVASDAMYGRAHRRHAPRRPDARHRRAAAGGTH